jgi:hypothetical protein
MVKLIKMTIIMLNFSSSMQTQLMFDKMEELRLKVRLHCSHPPTLLPSTATSMAAVIAFANFSPSL